jgi:phospholipid/cholesterol/gamma-HCH transport system ATP-binding protein
MFGPREVLLTSEEPVVSQFLNGRREGPIGMSEEKDTEQAAREMEEMDEELAGLPPMKKQLKVSKGMPERKAVGRRQQRVEEMMHTLPQEAQDAIRADRNRQSASAAGARSGAHHGQDAPTQQFPRTRG